MKPQHEALARQLVDRYRHLAFLVPTYKLIPTVFFHSFFLVLTQLGRLGFQVDLFMVDLTLVPRARNRLAHDLVQAQRQTGNRFTAALWLDTDQTFTTDDVLLLLQHYDQDPEIRILSGRYVTRDLSSPHVCAYRRQAEGHRYHALDPDTGGICEVDAVGFGFLLMDPQVLVEMYEAHGMHQFQLPAVGPKEEGALLGEDLFWCERARELGHHIHLDSDVTVGHYGVVIDDAYLRWRHQQ
jgi:hypothetical protein